MGGNGAGKHDFSESRLRDSRREDPCAEAQLGAVGVYADEIITQNGAHGRDEQRQKFIERNVRRTQASLARRRLKHWRAFFPRSLEG